MKFSGLKSKTPRRLSGRGTSDRESTGRELSLFAGADGAGSAALSSVGEQEERVVSTFLPEGFGGLAGPLKHGVLKIILDHNKCHRRNEEAPERWQRAVQCVVVVHRLALLHCIQERGNLQASGRARRINPRGTVVSSISLFAAS